MSDSCFKPFFNLSNSIKIPERFTFPFYYEPHELSKIASAELQSYLSRKEDWEHNFGLDDEQEGMAIGKMFGVLVVENEKGELGYLSAFSGKLANSNHHEGFVVPVYDILTEDGFFKKGEKILNALNVEIEKAENNKRFLFLKQDVVAFRKELETKTAQMKVDLAEAKKVRNQRREEAEGNLAEAELAELTEELRKESVGRHFHFKKTVQSMKDELQRKEAELAQLQDHIDALRKKRKQKSNDVQQEIFRHYTFLNALGEERSLLSIFENTKTVIPPAGAGECAAPKLLQHAYLNNYKPLAMAEFWWGQSPKSDIKKHLHYYPSCRSKCEPILGHMLLGLDVDPNPILEEVVHDYELEVVFEDESLVVINKPSEFLSVPGKVAHDSVLARMQKKYPDATGPLVVHRLDMSTSGLMLIAKSEQVHKKMQFQFIKRFIEKRYVALLEGEIVEDSGEIDLPLRVDLDNRPHQLVCYEHGKSALTKYEVIDRSKKGFTRVNFYPHTGRTHQLRVHASHPSGLNAPIVGDDLYGTKGKRLHLHAEYLKFKHPVSNEFVEILCKADF